MNGREQDDKVLLTSKGKENVREQEITGKEPARKIVRENEIGIEKGGETGVNSDGKRRENVSERGRTCQSQRKQTKETRKRITSAKTTTAKQQHVSRRLVSVSSQISESGKSTPGKSKTFSETGGVNDKSCRKKNKHAFLNAC